MIILDQEKGQGGMKKGQGGRSALLTLYQTTILDWSKFKEPRPGSSVVSVSDSRSGGCEFEASFLSGIFLPLKAFADKLNVVRIMISVSDRVENMVGKGENAGYQHFLLFPQCFQKALFSGSFKVGMVW